MPLRRIFGGKKPKRSASIGRRGAILIAMGVAWMLLGISTFVNPNTPGAEHLLHNIIFTNTVEGCLWIASGVIAVIFAHRTDDEYGFLALYVMPAIRTLSYFLGWLDYLSPVGGAGFALGWFSTLFYLIMIVFIVICAGWPEPPKAPDEVLQKIEEGTNSGHEGAEYQ